MPLCQFIPQQLNDTPCGFAARINSFLSGLGVIGLQDIQITRRDVPSGPYLSATITYTTPGPVALLATCFEGTPTNPADAQVTAFFAANPTYRAHFIRDLGSPMRRSLATDSLLVIYAQSSFPNCGFNRSKMILVKATQIIAAGDPGTVQRVTATGLMETLTAYNVSTRSFTTGEYGYAFPGPLCVWEVIPTCCFLPM